MLGAASLSRGRCLAGRKPRCAWLGCRLGWAFGGHRPLTCGFLEKSFQADRLSPDAPYTACVLVHESAGQRQDASPSAANRELSAPDATGSFDRSPEWYSRAAFDARADPFVPLASKKAFHKGKLNLWGAFCPYNPTYSGSSTAIPRAADCLHAAERTKGGCHGPTQLPCARDDEYAFDAPGQAGRRSVARPGTSRGDFRPGMCA